MPCGISRSEPAKTVPGFITSWRTRSVTVVVSPNTGLELDEAVVVTIDRPSNHPTDASGYVACLYSRVVSVIWQDAGDLVGLAVWTARSSDLASSEPKPSKPTFPKQVS